MKNESTYLPVLICRVEKEAPHRDGRQRGSPVVSADQISENVQPQITALASRGLRIGGSQDWLLNAGNKVGAKHFCKVPLWLFGMSSYRFRESDR